MDAALKERLTTIVGAKAVDAPAEAIAPATAEQVEQVCAACTEAGARIAVTSSAAARGGKPPDGAVTVSLARLAEVAVEPERLVVRAGAGTSLDALRKAAEKAGLVLTGVAGSLPGDTPVGELIARGQLSRRALTGIEAVLPGGERVGSGGAVLKDVAGYDLPAILLGSLGRLALVTAATFRLQPQSAPADRGEPAGVPTAVLGEALQLAFDPQRLLVARA